MLTHMAPLLTRMARMARLLTRMARMLTRMTRWLAGSHIIHTPLMDTCTMHLFDTVTWCHHTLKILTLLWFQRYPHIFSTTT